MIQVKICGIRSEMAARSAVYSGAKFLGFNFVPGSKRKIPPAFAKQIISQIKNQIKIVGVFQNQKIALDFYFGKQQQSGNDKSNEL